MSYFGYMVATCSLSLELVMHPLLVLFTWQKNILENKILEVFMH